MLHTLADHLSVIWGALLAASIVVLLTPAVGGMARLLGVVDRPEGRRLNRSTVPRLGGLALFFGVFVPALAFLNLSGETRGLLLGTKTPLKSSRPERQPLSDPCRLAALSYDGRGVLTAGLLNVVTLRDDRGRRQGEHKLPAPKGAINCPVRICLCPMPIPLPRYGLVE